MNVAILGTGYVGLVSGVCLAAKGHMVTCVDIRREVVDSLNRAIPHIHERGLSELLRQVVAENRFSATLDLDAALKDAELVIIAVGTPSENGKIDLRYIEAAARQIGSHIGNSGRYLSVVVKSTVVPSTTDTVIRKAIELGSGRMLGAFGLGMNPEFLREGNAVEDFMHPDRIVLGYEDDETLRRLQLLYAPWACEKIAVNTRTAEMIKYANNCLLATQISAVNELANLCSAIGGIDAMDVMYGVHRDKRWSPVAADGRRTSPQILSYLIPGCGFGGSCFPKDVQALRSHGEEMGIPVPILNGVLAINTQQPCQVVEGLRRHWGTLRGRRVVLLGLAFKPETDDLRESPARAIIASLASEGAQIVAHDPVALANARRDWRGIGAEFVEEWESELETADGVVIVTTWREYASLLDAGNAARLAGKAIFDARRMFTRMDFPQCTYLTIGYSPRTTSPITV